MHLFDAAPDVIDGRRVVALDITRHRGQVGGVDILDLFIRYR